MNKKEERFVQEVWDFYALHKRRHLLWRKTRDPYKILVSEVMLQQTQVVRVQQKYDAFISRFPTIQALSSAQLHEVLLLWQGLGYNRRAKMLHACAQEITAMHGGSFPKEYKELCALPGIGPYTAKAVLAFAYNRPVYLIETNVRSVFLHHFFKSATDVTDAKILKLVEKTLPQRKVREWYYALMDYGSYIKQAYGNPNSKSAHYAVQSAFKGSNREIRGAILRVLLRAPKSRAALLAELNRFQDARVDAQVEKMISEDLIAFDEKMYRIA